MECGFREVMGEDMSIGIWYWIFLAVALVFGLWPAPEGPGGRWFRWGAPLLWFILFVILGIAEFGGPIKG